MTSDEKIVQVARKLKSNFPLYAKNILRIVNKEGEVAPFILNEGQRWMHQRLDNQLQQQGNIRALVLNCLLYTSDAADDC